MMRYIILLLLLSSTLTAQTKLRQIERSATKWHVPAAWDSIPGVAGHAMKYIDLETLMDTVGIQQFGIDSLDYRNDSLLIWVGGGYYFAIIPQGLMGSGDDGSVAYWHQDTIAGDTVHFWDSTNKRLGLNTKSPTSLLHVKKNEYALPVAEFDNPGTNGQTVLIKHGASSDGRYPLKIQTPAATNYFDARGYLGLGVSPSYPLHVKNTTGISRFENTNSNGDAGFDLYHSNKWWRIAMNAEGGTTNNVHFRDITGSRYPLTLQSSNGYVGILNLTPARELHVTGRVRVSTLDSDLTPPTTAGPTKMVITDEDGDLSFANIPTVPADSTVVTQGFGITVTESPTNTYNIKSDTSKMATIWDVSQVDQSATNELQTLSHSSTTTTHTTTLSNSGGSLILKEGSNVTLTTSGNEVTIASTASGGGIDSTIIIGGYGITSVESPLNTFNIVADTTQMQRRIVLSTNGTSGPATLTGALNLNVPQYQAQLTNPVTGTGTTNYVSKFTGTSTIGDSQIQDNGTTVGIGGLDANYKFYQAAGDAKIGGTTGYHRLFFGDATNVYVGEWDLTNRLYLRGGSMTLDIGGSRGTNGQVLTSNGASASWVTPSTSSGTVTSVGVNVGTGLTVTPSGSNPITTSGTFTLGNTANLTLTNTSDPTINTNTAGAVSGIQLVGSNGITISGNTNTKVVTITGSGGGTTPQTWGDFTTNIQVWNSTGTYGSGKDVGIGRQPTRDFDVYGTSRLDGPLYSTSNSPGSAGDVLTSNGVSAWTWQTPVTYTYGQLTWSTSSSVAIGTSPTKVDFGNSTSNGSVTLNTTNDNITINATGVYEINYVLNTNGTSNRNVTAEIYKNGSASFGTMQQTVNNDIQSIKYSGIQSLNINDVIDLRVNYSTATGSGTSINYNYQTFTIKRLK